MANLANLLANGGTATITYLDDSVDPIVEPLDGFATVDQIMDRFPEEVYNKSRDSHLYKFMEALCGDSGAGILKKQSYMARLKNEGALLTFKDLDTFYTQHFVFPRLPDERYEQIADEIDTETDILTKQEWDSIRALDDMYRNRIKLFFQSTRMGNSPEGMALAAEAGSGVHCDIWENYKAFYDGMSDDPLGIDYQGQTTSPAEFVVIPRIVAADGSGQGPSYISELNQTPAHVYVQQWSGGTAYVTGDIVTPNQVASPKSSRAHFYYVTTGGTSNVTQPTWHIDGTAVTDGSGVVFLDVGTTLDDLSYNEAGDNSADPDANDMVRFDPEYEHNMVHVMDQVKPVGTLMSIQVAGQHFVPIFDDTGAQYNPTARASSNNFKVTRYVTGRVAVNWPPTDDVTGDNSAGFWIVGGEERQQKDFPLIARDRIVIWQTVDNAHAYTNLALDEEETDAYNTPGFYGGDLPTYPKYRSQHRGPTQGDFALIFPFLHNAPKDDTFTPVKAIALQTTPLILEGRHK